MAQNDSGKKDAIPNFTDESAQDVEQPFIAHYAASRWGITNWNYSDEEYSTLRNYVLSLHLNDGTLAELDKCFAFIHEQARAMRTGAHNSMTGMCYDIAIRNYANVAETIEKTLVEYTAE